MNRPQEQLPVPDHSSRPRQKLNSLCFLGSGPRRTCLLLSCVFWGSIFAQGQHYVKIATEIEHIDYFSRDANGKIIEKHWPISVHAIAGTDEWRIDNNFAKNAEIAWFFDGT